MINLLNPNSHNVIVYFVLNKELHRKNQDSIENHIIVYYISFVFFDILISRFSYYRGPKLSMDDQQITQLSNHVLFFYLEVGY